MSKVFFFLCKCFIYNVMIVISYSVTENKMLTQKMYFCYGKEKFFIFFYFGLKQVNFQVH